MRFKRTLCFSAAFVMLFAWVIPAFADDEVAASVTSSGAAQNYTSFEEAWNKAVEAGKSGDVTFKLNKNWIAGSDGSLGSGSGFSNGALKYSGKNNLTIDLNGCKIDRNVYSPKGSGAVIYVDSVLTIADSGSDNYTVSKLFKGGAITGGSNSDAGGGVVISGGATLNFNGGTILNCVSTDEGGAVFAGSGAKLNVNGGNFYGNRTYDALGECYGGAICARSSEIVIRNSVFEDNYAEDPGGAIYVNDGNIKISDSSFNSNISNEEGGAIYLDGDVKSDIRDCLFSGNSSSDDDGGALYCNSDDGTYFRNCRMYYNYSASEGGAIHINADKVYVMGGEYRYNSAKEHGGGIYVDSMYDINASGKLIVSDNTVGDKSNNLCLQDGNITTAYMYCGGFYDGSKIGICSSDGSSRLAIIGISKTQYDNYITFDPGFTEQKLVKSEDDVINVRAEASAFGSGNVLMIIIMSAVIIVAADIILIYKKKKKVKGAEAVD